MRAPTAEEHPGTRVRRVLRAVLRVIRIASLVLLVPLLVYLWPVSLGGKATIVFVSGESMLPTISTDDVVVARAADSYAIGDVVVVEIPEGEPGAGERIIHRLVGGSSTTGWFTQGDNRQYPDQWMLSDGDIVGRAQVIAPLGDETRLLFTMMLWPVTWGAVCAVGVFRVAWRRLGDDERGDTSGDEPPHTLPATGCTVRGDVRGSSDANGTVDGRRTGGRWQLVGRRSGRER